MNVVIIGLVASLVSTTPGVEPIQGVVACDSAIQCAQLYNDHRGQVVASDDDGNQYVLVDGTVIAEELDSATGEVIQPAVAP
jgi:hypothetical protein